MGALFLSLAALTTAACGASMKPIPDDVDPVPQSAMGAKHLGDAAVVALADAAPHVALGEHEAPVACVDNRHRALRVQKLSADRWAISRGVIDAVRNERKAQISPVTDQLGNVIGASLESITDSCLAVLGFMPGDLIKSINGYIADWNEWARTYQSIIKDGTAVVRFDRDGKAMTVLYEVRNE